jgi:type II secretory pathway component PulJ
VHTTTRRRRFTLVEVIIAVTIFLLVVGLMVGFGREMSRSWERLRAEQARFRELLALDRTLDALLSNGVPFQWPDADGEAVPFFVGRADAVRLASLQPLIDLEEGSLRFSVIFVDNGELIVSYTARPYLDEPDPGAVRQAVLARGVERIEFAYADQSNDESGRWSERAVWEDEWKEDRSELPLAIMATVTWQDGRVESWLRRIGSGYRERWGKWAPAKDAD